ncbi:MAG: hypothetical protein PSX80_02635 [bacterium]|nr:hypothetical protein [bacterium]
MYCDEGLSYRAIGERIGTSGETIRSILREAGVAVQRKHWKPRQHVEEIRRLYVEENKPITEIVGMLNVTPGLVSKTLRYLGIPIKRGGVRSIVYPELRQLKIGESLELPRVPGTRRHAYTRYYVMAKKAGIKVSVRVISNDKVRVSRKS